MCTTTRAGDRSPPAHRGGAQDSRIFTMEVMMRVILLLSVGLLGCSGLISDAAPPAVLDEPFVLEPGETVVVEGTALEVTFREVSEDSRCPVDATCVWAGNAGIAVETALDGVERAFRLNTTVHPSTGPRSADLDGYRLELVGLEPEPRTGRSIPQRDYRASFLVTRTD